MMSVSFTGRTSVLLCLIFASFCLCFVNLVTCRNVASGPLDQPAEVTNQPRLSNESDFYYILSSPNGTITGRINQMTSNSYKNGNNNQWLINVTSAIGIKFTELKLRSCCFSVELYDETQEVRNESLRYRVDKLKPITGDDELKFWLRGPVVIRFTSQHSGDEFSLNYSVISDQKVTLPTQVIRSRRGYIESHYGFQNYSDNTLKSWSFIQSELRVLEINFIKFDTESPTDLVQIFPGLAPDVSKSSALFQHSGSLTTIKGKSFRFIGNVTLVFQSDSTRSGKGFVAKFNSFRKFALSATSGRIRSFRQKNSTKYLKNTDDRWLINVTDAVMITFDQFRTDGIFDVLKIYENTLEPSEASLRFVLKGVRDSADSLVLQGPVVIQLLTDASINYEGFSLRYRTVNKKEFPVVTRIIKNSKIGEISSDMQTASRKDGTIYSQAWKLLVEPNQMVVINFTELSLLSSKDFMNIFIGDNEAVKRSNSKLQLTKENSTLTEAMFSSADNVTISFQSDSRENNAGFKLKYYFQNVHSSNRGNISLNEDRSVLEQRDEVSLINLSGFVNLKFKEFSLEECCQVVEIYQQVNHLFRRSADRPVFCLKTKADAKFEFRLRGPVIVRFITSSKVSFSNFLLEYSVIQAANSSIFTPAKVRQVVEPGFITDNVLVCDTENQTITRIMSLSKKPNQKLFLELKEFESSSSENLVEIYSGLNAKLTDLPIFKFSGKLADIPQRIFFHSDNLTFLIKSNCATEGLKFSISFKTANVLPSKGDADISGHCAKNYETYETDCDQRWIINTTALVKIQIKKVDFNRCCDKLFLFDNSTIDQNENFKFQIRFGDQIFTKDEFLLQGPVLIRHRSKGGDSSARFHLTYSVVESENSFNEIPTKVVHVTRGREIKSRPKFGSNYPRNHSIQWRLSVPRNEILQVKFNKFDLELPNSSLKLFAGFPANLQFIQPLFTWSGQLSDFNQTTFTCKGSCTLLLESGSDAESGEGFIASVDSYSLLPSPRGIVMSRKDPKTYKYYNHVDDKWMINVTEKIRIVFVEMDVTRMDKLSLYENTNSATEFRKSKYVSNARRKSKRIDMKRRFEVFMQGPVVVRFQTRASSWTTRRGFKLFYEIVPKTSSKSTSTSTGVEMPRNRNTSSLFKWINF